MQTSYQLLKLFFPSLKLNPHELAEKLTMQGLEVESIKNYANNISNIIIAQIIKIENHPDAEKLSICSVNTGKEILQVVCGAKNFKEQDKVPFAPIGTVMPSGIEIKQAKIRGVDSFGMLCSSKELGLFEAEGLWILPDDAPIGQTISSVYIEPDTIYEFSLTPNRGDCLGTLGIAREVVISAQDSIKNLTLPTIEMVTTSGIPPIVHIKTPSCKRYIARTIHGIKIQESPIWLKNILKLHGLQSINNIVDISNYIMMQFGHPVHIFDLDKVTMPLNIVAATHNENIELLSGNSIPVPEKAILIKDAQTNIALAGIMGGLSSSVTNKTQNILLEVAYFTPDSIRHTLQSTHLHTNASHRFTRNTDIAFLPKIMDYLTSYILKVSTAATISNSTDIYPQPQKSSTISVSLNYISQQLGFTIPVNTIEKIFHQLDFDFVKNQETYTITIPSYRNDCCIPIDIVEEILRIYGYDAMPISLPQTRITLDKKLPQTPLSMKIKEFLTTFGLNEIYTFSLTKPENNQNYPYILESLASVELRNPLNTELSVLRVSLFSTVSQYLIGLLEKGYKTFHGFEIGNIFTTNAQQEVVEQTHLLLFQMGEKMPHHFKQTPVLVDFYDTKSHLEHLFMQLGISQFICYKENSTISFLHPYKTAEIFYKEKSIGYIGEIQPKFWDTYKGKNNLIVSEINLSVILSHLQPIQQQRSYISISRFPKVERDLAFILNKSIPASTIVEKILSISPLVIKAEAIDNYENPKLGEENRSLSFRIILQSPTETLTEELIQPIINEIIHWVKIELHGILREF